MAIYLTGVEIIGEASRSRQIIIKFIDGIISIQGVLSVSHIIIVLVLVATSCHESVNIKAVVIVACNSRKMTFRSCNW